MSIKSEVEKARLYLIDNPTELKNNSQYIASKIGVNFLNVIKARAIIKRAKQWGKKFESMKKVEKSNVNEKFIGVFKVNKSSKLDDNNVLVIADTHFPFEKEGYLDFCLDIQKKYKCGKVVHIGDEIDNCAVSQYVKNPDGLASGSEAEMALESIKEWYKAFPKVDVVIGNHTARPFRLAHDAGLSKKFIKPYEQIWEAPKGWQWKESYDIYGVHYTHGTGTSGPNAALKRAIQLRKPVCCGHIHTEATVQYNVSAIDAIWGMIVGSGIDDKQYAFHYAKDNLKKSIISCGVVLESGKLPIIELMSL